MRQRTTNIPAHIDPAELPRNVRFDSRGSGRWEYRYHNGSRKSVTLGPAAMTAADIQMKVDLINGPRIDINEWSRRLAKVVRNSAKSRGLENTLDADTIARRIRSSNARCEISGLPFNEENPTNSRKRPWIPSVDRIDCKKGYHRNNIRIVCSAINIAINDWGDDVLTVLATALLKWKKRELKTGNDGE